MSGNNAHDRATAQNGMASASANKDKSKSLKDFDDVVPRKIGQPRQVGESRKLSQRYLILV